MTQVGRNLKGKVDAPKRNRGQGITVAVLEYGVGSDDDRSTEYVGQHEDVKFLEALVENVGQRVLLLFWFLLLLLLRLVANGWMATNKEMDDNK